MQNSAKRASTALFAFMIVVLVAGAIVPIFTRNMSTTQQPQPTTVPTATFPAPPALTGITFDQLYLQPSGIFAVGQPTGWTPSTPVNDAERAAITMVNNDALSVIEATVDQPATPVANADELSERFDQTYLSASWSRYGTWEETARRVEDNRLILDFNLTLNRQQYIARQISWTDGDWIYSTRAVAPANANQMVVHLVTGLADSLVPFKQFAGTPFNWTAYYDTIANHIIRYPAAWRVEDTAPGGPTSIVGTSGETLRLERASSASVTSEADAEAWLSQRQPNATVLSVTPVTRGDAEGFAVAYSTTSVDGDPLSGLAVLLNDANGALHSANLRFAASSLDLNALSAPAEAEAEATAEAPASSGESTLAQVMGTFSLMPETLDIVGAAATPTPLPTVAPTAEVTEAAPEAMATEAASATEAAPETEATAEATEAS
jgi:hypothetical protein